MLSTSGPPPPSSTALHVPAPATLNLSERHQLSCSLLLPPPACCAPPLLQEEAARLAEALGDATPSPDIAAGRLMVPPTPIMREDNWPLLTVSKGFFETLAVKGESWSGQGLVMG